MVQGVSTRKSDPSCVAYMPDSTNTKIYVRDYGTIVNPSGTPTSVSNVIINIPMLTSNTVPDTTDINIQIRQFGRGIGRILRKPSSGNIPTI